jgi:hypothetical protein
VYVLRVRGEYAAISHIQHAPLLDIIPNTGTGKISLKADALANPLALTMT